MKRILIIVSSLAILINCSFISSNSYEINSEMNTTEVEMLAEGESDGIPLLVAIGVGIYCYYKSCQTGTKWTCNGTCMEAAHYGQTEWECIEKNYTSVQKCTLHDKSYYPASSRYNPNN